MDFSEVFGWLLLRKSFSQDFFRIIINFYEQTSQFVYIALLNHSYMKESVTVNKK